MDSNVAGYRQLSSLGSVKPLIRREKLFVEKPHVRIPC